MTSFSFAPLHAWQLSQMGRDRSSKLLSQTPFEEIVARLDREARLHSFGWNKGTQGDKIGKRRWWVRLTISPEAVDLWHNSHGGYRAQYYVNPELGDKANAYAHAVLAPTAERLIGNAQRSKRFFPSGAASIGHSATRLWIHQGLWLHWKKTEGRLRVPRWQDEARAALLKKLGEWAQLTPGDETDLVLKGQWLLDGLPVADLPKTGRAVQLHKFGFT